MTRRGSGGGTQRQNASQHGRPTEVRESLTLNRLGKRRAEVGVGGVHSVCLAASRAGGFKSLWCSGKEDHIRTRG